MTQPTETPPPTQLPLPERPARPQPPAVTPDTHLKDAINAWIVDRRKEGLADNTLKAFRADMFILAEYTGNDRPLGRISTVTLNNFLDWMRHDRGRPCSDKTYDRRVTTLKAFFRWATAAADLPDDPAGPVINLSVRSPLPEILSEDDIRRAYSAAARLRDGADSLPETKRGARKPDSRPFMLFTLALHTGMKKSEVAALRLEHLHLTDPSPHLYVRYDDPRHRNKERRLRLPEEWVAAFAGYQDEHEIKDTVFPWSVRRLEYLLADIATVALLDTTISFDKLRWTGAVMDYLAGMPPDEQRRKLGLSDVQWGEVRRKIQALAGDDDDPPPA